MSSLKTLAIIATLWTGTAFASAMPSDPEDLVRGFATCAGRYSAEYESGHMLAQIDTQAAKSHRDAFVSLIQAVIPDVSLGPKTDAIVLSWRIEAKAAHGALLATATFDYRSDRAHMAMRIADNHMVQCRRLLLGA
ncbi:MAG: hypothetical protein AAFN59_13735 [Pseudomonadota bacterium]